MEMNAAREENDLKFSYDLVRPLSYPADNQKFRWTVTEKGSKQSNLEERYKISYDIIKSALSQIKEHICSTPYDQIQCLGDRKYDIILKKELDQVTNSVKARGVVYTLLQLSGNQRRKGVIGISTGNFAHSLCHFGKEFNIPVTIVMPESERCKKSFQKCLDLGATVYFHDNIKVAHEEAFNMAMERGLVYINGNDHPDMIIGQATLGIEMMEQVENVDAVILPTSVKDCGLTAGIAMAIKGRNPDIKVIEAQYSKQDYLTNVVRREPLRLNELDIPKSNIYAWYSDDREIVKRLFDKTVTVTNMSVTIATDFLLQLRKNVDDYNARIGLAALFCQLDELNGKRVIIPVFGKMDTINPSAEPSAGPSNS